MDDNPFAFPFPDVRDHEGCGIRAGSDGMTLRDWFAGQAIGAIIGAVSAGQHRTYEANTGSDLPAIMAADAYEIADAMLVARSAS